jgi:hypothetical protein
MHWKMLVIFFAQLRNIAQASLVGRALSLLWLALSAYGVIVFIRREMFAYLAVQLDYAFLDYSEPVSGFYLDYLAVTVLFAYTTRFLLWLCLFRN